MTPSSPDQVPAGARARPELPPSSLAAASEVSP